MKNFSNLSVSVDGYGILIITINRPDKLNALNFETLEELDEAISLVYNDNLIKGAIITGAGNKAFVAGADIKEFINLNEFNGRKAAERGQEIFQKIEDCFKPIIAAVNGFALGGGCELAMACHLRIASPNAIFGQPEINIGILPAYGGTQRLPKLIGKGRALEFLLTTDNIDAEKAYQFGLVNKLVNADVLIEETKNMLIKIFSKAPLPVGMIIESVNIHDDNERNGYNAEANFFGHCCETKDFKEGINAFVEKRKPSFNGN
ncbi:MAG: enoyl-CoA hydratase-related protein [Cytophagales bacterium]